MILLSRGMVVFLYCVIALAGGCAEGTHRQLVRHYVDVSAEEFTFEYEAPGTASAGNEYVGVVRGYHVMDMYAMTTGTWASYVGSLRVPVAGMPSGFPERPQATLMDRTVERADDIYRAYYQKSPFGHGSRAGIEARAAIGLNDDVLWEPPELPATQPASSLPAQ